MVYVPNVLTSSREEASAIQSWLSSIENIYGTGEISLIRQACDFVAPLYEGHQTATGNSFMESALAIADILSSIRADPESLAAALLKWVPKAGTVDPHQLEERFGKSIAGLVEGVNRMVELQHLSTADRDGTGHTESLRKMLLAMVEDIRVVLIALADRVETMRHLKVFGPEEPQRIARETLEIFSPLANRLGIWQLKWELEDSSLRYLEPELYKKIARLLDERRVDREQYIARVMEVLRTEMTDAGIPFEIAGRPKHIYSIWRKMKLKHLDFSEIYDVRAVRILVDDIKNCYTVLGIVHSLWRPIPGEFDDYIAHPKRNDYRSLHTAVIGPENKALEVQIRTFDMHKHAELGVAAHWRYKEGSQSNVAFDEKIAWLRQILEWKDEIPDAGEWVEHFKNDLFRDRVYVLTPQGRVVDLPQGATPLDFAYAVHTDLGHRCRGAKVEGSIVPLTYKLQNAQRVEILTAKQGGPSRDWLNSQLGFAVTSRAKAKMRQWFHHEHYEDDAALGRVALDRELDRLHAHAINTEKLAQRFHVSKVDDFFAALGRGDINSRQLSGALEDLLGPVARIPVVPAQRREHVTGRPGEVIIQGVGKLETNLAKCCNPVPPMPIIAYITVGRGVTVHRQDCPNIIRLDDIRRERLLDAYWGGIPAEGGGMGLLVEAEERQGLLRDVTALLASEKIHVLALQTGTRNGTMDMRFRIEGVETSRFAKLTQLLRTLPGVVRVASF